MRDLLALAFFLSATAVAAHSGHPPLRAIQDNGLSARVLFTGADRAQHSLTVSVRVTNTAGTPGAR